MAQFIKKKKGWAVRFYLDEKEENGEQKRVYLSGHKTKKEAENAMQEYIEKAKQGIDLKDTTTVKEFFEYWFDNYAVSNLSGRSKKDYASLITLHIIPFLGKYQLNKLKPTAIQSLYTHLRDDKKLSSATILKVHRIMHKAFKSAVQWNYLISNTIDYVNAPKASKKEMNILSEKELGQVLEIAKETRAYIPILIAASTGMRLGEVCGLQNEDVDIKNQSFYIKHQYQRIAGKMTLSNTKTNRSNRPVSILKDIIPELEKYISNKKREKIAAGPKYNINNFFCVWENGQPILPDYVSKTFKKAVKKIGRENVRFHDLRHTHASILLKKEVHPKIVQERLGHSSIQITLDTYSHVIPNLQKEVLNNINISSFDNLDDKNIK